MATKNKYIILTDENFQQEVLDSAGPILVDFFVSWKGASQIMVPIIVELAVEFEGKIKVGRMDVDNNSQIPSMYGIRKIPTFMLFKKGEVVDQVVGMARKIELVEKLNNLF